VGSGGSSGGRKWCLQPLAHLEASADATGRWLAKEGIDPVACLHLDPLPLHHVSGLLPLVRARRWRAELRWLPAALMREPDQLAEALPLPADRPVLISLVPTQLLRLMASPVGTAWLRGCAVIWVGGAALSPEAAAQARQAGLALSPCYGATETAAMVCALPPRRFLAGEDGCGNPFDDVRLRIDPATTAVEIITERLSPGELVAGALRPLPRLPDGWWRSGDGGRLGPGGLAVLGRLDRAFHSGGETVYPEQLEARLLEEASLRGLALAAALMLPQDDPEWGGRLVALVRFAPLPFDTFPDEGARLQALRTIAASWPAAERPLSWKLCPELAPTPCGKWELSHWQEWLAEAGVSPG
jgi:O-succinylbenzoic acid--CoA ligase